MIIRNNVIPWLSRLFGLNATAVTIGPFIFVKDGKASERLIRHEVIHTVQWLELWYVGFLFLYIWDWAVGLCRGYGLKGAYRAIRFEQEARAGQNDPDYLNARERMAWRRFQV